MGDYALSTTSRWPRCLKEFKLQSLRIHRIGGPLLSPPLLLREVKQLHKGLKSFELRGTGVVASIYPYHVEIDSEFAGHPSNSLNGYPEFFGCFYSDPWDVKASFPELRRFILSEDIDGEISFGFALFDPNILHYFPSTLTHLEFPYMFLEDVDDWSFLPKGLLTLRLGKLRLLPEAGIKTLPKSLTDLEMHDLFIKEPTLFPHLKLPGKQLLDADLDLFSSGKCEVPSSMERMTISKPQWDLNLLPSALTYLNLDDWDNPFVGDQIAVLPRTLTTLLLPTSSVDWWTLTARTKVWPPNLSRLEIGFSTHFGAICFHLLPRSLQWFSIGAEGVEERPRTVKSHNQHMELLAQGKDLPFLTSEGIKCLKDEADLWRLEKAKIETGGVECEKYISAIEAGGLFGLPLPLADLYLGQLECPIEKKLIFPRLHQLNYHRRLRADDSIILSGFSPKGSLQLRVSIRGPKETLQNSQYTLYHSHVTALTIHMCTASLEGSSFQCLPRTLRRLFLSGPSFVYNHEIADLPPKLEHLRIGCSVQEPLSWVSLLNPPFSRMLGAHLRLRDREATSEAHKDRSAFLRNFHRSSPSTPSHFAINRRCCI